MLPLRDDNPRLTTPFFTVLLILSNVGVFLYQLALRPRAEQQFVYSFAMIPARITLAFTSPSITLGRAFVPLVTSIFLYASWLLLLGTMWFMWVFGSNIE